MDNQIRRTSMIRINTDMLSGRVPSTCACNLIPSLLNQIISSMDGLKLKYIDVTVSGIWEEAEDPAGNAKAQAKTQKKEKTE